MKTQGPQSRHRVGGRPAGRKPIEFPADGEPAPANPPPLTTVPKPPCSLGEEGKRRWSQYCAILVERGVLTRDFLLSVEHLCRCYDSLAQMDAEIARKGHIVPGPRGREMANPLLAMRTQIMILVRSLLNDFGLTPASFKSTNGRPPQKASVIARDRAADAF